VLISGSASDDSGLASVAFSVTDGYGERQPVIDQLEVAGEATATFQQQVLLDTTLRRGDWTRLYTITVTVSDLAGNVTSSSARVVVCRWMRVGGPVEATPPVVDGDSGAAAGPAR
jgi:hypothetical protein